MKRNLPLTAFLLLLSSAMFAQTYTLSNALTGNAQYATTCTGTFEDDGGAGNYTNGVDASYTFYPTAAGQYTVLTFTAFSTQVTADYLSIYDGPSGPLIGTYSGTPGGFTVTASASNSTRGLTCRFHANGNTVSSGWSATISCTGTPGAAPAFTPSAQDCEQGGGMTICDNANLTANSGGGGTVDDLSNPWDGCLAGGENQSSWYYFSPSAGGTVGFTIAPSNGTDDYDFALWGPFTSVQCPVNISVQPLRCSYSGTGGNTGCGNGAIDVSEGAGGNAWVSTFNVLSGEIYVMVIDNFVSSGNPFTLTWNLSGGADLNCTVLPVELISVWGTEQPDFNQIQWQTATETNNDYFTIERSANGGAWDSIGTIDGAGNSTQILDYEFRDDDLIEGICYYRLRQRDFNGTTTLSEIIYIVRSPQNGDVTSVYPVPSTGQVSVEYNTVMETSVDVQIESSDGRPVQQSKRELSTGKNVIPLDLSTEPDGVYLLRITDAVTGQTTVRRIIIASQD